MLEFILSVIFVVTLNGEDINQSEIVYWHESPCQADSVQMTEETKRQYVCKREILPPCESEDSEEWCVWDASSEGNGIGDSFAVLGGESPIVVYEKNILNASNGND